VSRPRVPLALGQSHYVRKAIPLPGTAGQFQPAQERVNIGKKVVDLEILSLDGALLLKV